MDRPEATLNKSVGEGGRVPGGYVPNVVALLRPERAVLIELLATLTAEQWSTSTECPAWTVQGIALHLLGDDVSLLARQRDAATSGLLLYAYDHPGQNFRQLLNGFNEQWVSASLFTSGPLLMQLLSATGQWTTEFYESVDLNGLGEPVGMFGVSDASPYWQIIAREYVERWAHQHQIRRAVGAPELGAEFLLGAANVIAATLAPAMAGIVAEDGHAISVEIPDVGCWTYESANGTWGVEPSHSSPEGPRLTLDRGDATLVLSRGLDRTGVLESFRASGDDPVAAAMKLLLSGILARP